MKKFILLITFITSTHMFAETSNNPKLDHIINGASTLIKNGIVPQAIIVDSSVFADGQRPSVIHVPVDAATMARITQQQSIPSLVAEGVWEAFKLTAKWTSYTLAGLLLIKLALCAMQPSLESKL